MVDITEYEARQIAQANASGRTPVIFIRPQYPDNLVEPNLPRALASLPKRQRQAVVLVHAEGWTLLEVGELLGISVPTVQKHAERGMAALRRALKVDSQDHSW